MTDIFVTKVSNSAQQKQGKIELHGWFGGTFNPVHNGHVASAREIYQVAGFRTLQLMPCHRPAHRDQPDVSSAQRLYMLELALQDIPELRVDGRELERAEFSYTADSLELIQREFPEAHQHLCWIMGVDSFATFTSWERWQTILDVAHLIVMARPGFELLPSSAEYALFNSRKAEHIGGLKQQRSGLIHQLELTPYPVSSSAIREAINSKQAVEQYLNPRVAEYIKHNDLYR